MVSITIKASGKANLACRPCVVAWTLLLLVGLAAPDVAPLADGVGSHEQPTRTAKGDSASRRVTSSGSTIARCPHHRAYGSVSRRFGGLSIHQLCHGRQTQTSGIRRGRPMVRVRQN